MGLFRIKDAICGGMSLSSGEKEKLTTDQFNLQQLVIQFGTTCYLWDNTFDMGVQSAKYYGRVKAAKLETEILPRIQGRNGRSPDQKVYDLERELEYLRDNMPLPPTEASLLKLHLKLKTVTWDTPEKRAAWIAKEYVGRRKVWTEINKCIESMSILLADWTKVTNFSYNIHPGTLGAFANAQMAEAGAGGGGTLGQMRGLLAEC